MRLESGVRPNGPETMGEQKFTGFFRDGVLNLSRVKTASNA